jgi:alcohol dehydrogenase
MSRIAAFGLQTPTPVEFGVGVAAQVGARAAALGMRHALIVTDAGLTDSPGCATVQRSLAAAGVASSLFSGVVLDPTSASVRDAVAAYRGAGVDGIVALGGGSALDTAKALGVLALAGGDDITPFFFGGPQAVPGMVPLICLPTTAGTGAEVTFVSVITDAMQKRIVRDVRIAPTLALIDPELTLTMPPRLTAATGLDALSHALEAVTSRLASPPSDALALDALARIQRWLPQAVANGEDIVAREQMSLAAMLAGIAFVNGRVHLGHAVGHALGTHYKLAHGFACAICLPNIMDFLRPHAEDGLSRAATVLGGDVVNQVRELLTTVHAPRLAEALGGEPQLDHLVTIVHAEDRLIGLSRGQPTAEEWRTIFALS